MMLKKINVTAIILIAVLAAGMGIWWQQHNRQPPATQAITLLSPPRAIRQFTLTDDHKQTFTNKNLQGKWSLLFFGFTHCPNICPTTLAVLNKTYQQLQQNNVHPLPQVVFISVDPKRDTPKVIRHYLAGFNKHFIGATGTKQQIDQLTQDFSVMYMKTMQTEDKQNNYMIDHSGAILITDPKGQLYGILTSPHDPTVIANDVEAIIG